MEGERRLPGFNTFTLTDVMVYGGCAAQISHVEGAIGLEHLRMTQGDFSSGGCGNLESHDADHVLSQVKRPAARLRLTNGLRFDLANLSHRFHYLRLKM